MDVQSLRDVRFNGFKSQTYPVTTVNQAYLKNSIIEMRISFKIFKGFHEFNSNGDMYK